MAVPDGGDWGVRVGRFVEEVKDETEETYNGDKVGDGVTHASVPHGVAFDPVILVVECEVDESGPCNLPTSYGEGGEGMVADKEGNVAESKWGGLGVRPALRVLSRAEKEEEGEDHEVDDGSLDAGAFTADLVEVEEEGEGAGRTRVGAGSSLRYLASWKWRRKSMLPKSSRQGLLAPTAAKI